MNEKKVLSQEEIDELKELQNTFKNLTEVSGVIEMQHYNIQLKKNNWSQIYKVYKKKKLSLLKI